MEIFSSKLPIYTIKISLILFNVVSYYILCKFFVDKCLKMRLLIDVYINYYAYLVCKYSLADLNKGHVLTKVFSGFVKIIWSNNKDIFKYASKINII